MIKRVLNIGVSQVNGESLNRKIRLSNLIALISMITMSCFLPLAIYVGYLAPLILVLFFFSASLTNLILHANKKHQLSFYVFTICGFIYFFSATVTYGLISNLHFFMLIMCMISVVIFDNKIVIRSFIVLAIILFFTLRWYMNDKTGLVHFPPEMYGLEERVGNIILFLLFVITAIFFNFFKYENLKYQKEVVEQKEIIEEKNKDITASITYAKRIQQSLMPTEKYIDKNIKRLKK